MTIIRITIRVTEIASIASSDRVATLMSPKARIAIRTAATSAITIQSAPFQMPVPLRNAPKKRPISEARRR